MPIGPLRRRLSSARRWAADRRDTWAPFLICGAISLAAGGAVLGVRAGGWLQDLELRLYDGFVRATPGRNSDDVVVVGISEHDIKGAAGGPRLSYPVSDDDVATILENLLRFEPSAIGLDIFKDDAPLKGSDDDPSRKARRRLVDLITAHPNVVCVVGWGKSDTPAIHAPTGVPEEQTGFSDWPEDSDFVVRRHWLYLSRGDGDAYSLAGRLALVHRPDIQRLKFPKKDFPKVRWGEARFLPLTGTEGGYRIPPEDIGDNYQFMMDFATRRFRNLSGLAVLSGHLNRQDVDGKVVLIGMKARSVKDLLATPVAYDGFGVDAHAMAVDQLIRMADGNLPPGSWSNPAEAAWTLPWAVAGGVLAYGVRRPLLFVSLLAAGVIALVTFAYRALVAGWWVPLLPPAAALVAAAGAAGQYMSFQEKARRVLLRSVTNPFISKQVVDLIWRHRDDLLEDGRLAAQEATFTILFADLKGFTSIAEDLPPKRVMGWVTQYLAAMSELVESHGGMVVKYMGDGFMAVFGAPVVSTSPEQHKRDAANAVGSALGMRDELAKLAVAWREEFGSEVCMRVGVYSGPAVSGTVGSARRMEYTILGDTVNVASRLESLRKEMMAREIAVKGCRIFIGQSTLDLLDGRFEVRPIGDEVLTGRDLRVSVYAVLGRRDQTPHVRASSRPEPSETRASV